MDDFNYQQHQLMAEGLSCDDIAEQWNTPTFVYSKNTLYQHWQAFAQPLQSRPHLICYAVKANPNIAILQQFARWGAGFDVVSIGELERALMAHADPQKIVFAGVGKQRHEIQRALEVGIKCFNVESSDELQQINQIAQSMHKKAPVALRLNPNIDAKTHPYISTGLNDNKFGILIDEAITLYQQAQQMTGIEIRGVACHIGSQLTELAPFVAALKALLNIIDALKQQNIHLSHCDIGGGLGVRYHDETPPLPHAYIEALNQQLGDRQIELVIEPGRAIAANAGILLTRVIATKQHGDKHFAIVDAAMNDLLRPALYNAWHTIIPTRKKSTGHTLPYDIVGPICESSDFLGKNRLLNISTGDLLAVRSVGAYGFSMSSQYNSRPRATELMVDQNTIHAIRKRERFQDLIANEQLIPDDNLY